MTDNEFITKTLNDARPDGTGFNPEKFRLKVISDAGESHWVSIPADRFDAVVAAASGNA